MLCFVYNITSEERDGMDTQNIIYTSAEWGVMECLWDKSPSTLTEKQALSQAELDELYGILQQMEGANGRD